ncbi:probable inactive heme oxygenase 2, chloroplastic [Jatropha curcas]|nr:probable inactive heme oxygenase 2, chloroplastic [Jatropha curcas]
MCLFSLTTISMAPPMEPHVNNTVFHSSQSKVISPILTRTRIAASPLIMCCSNSNSSFTTTTTTQNMGPPVIKKRKRYRKPYPGEKKGITEEMRFVAMRLRNLKGKYTHKSASSDDEDDNESRNSQNNNNELDEKEEEGALDGETWVASMEGFVKYLVDSKLVFDTIERIVDKSDDVSYTYFRRTGLERSQGIAKDLEWFSQQDIAIPEPSAPGVSYAKYLNELAEKSAPLFLCHFYNIYFSHIAGGQVIARQVSEKILKGRELEFYRWDGDVQELLKGTRENLNMLGEHWSRDVKNKCLKEATKSFRYLGQIVRLIIS